MSFTGAINAVISNFANFQGRAVRSEYWYWLLFCVLIGFGIGIISAILSAILGTRVIGYVIEGLFELAILVPSIAVAIRRLHDLDKSGWWLLISIGPSIAGFLFAFVLPFLGHLFSFAALVCDIVLLVWFCMPGTRGPNRFGGGGDSFARPGPMPMPVGFN
jgi:uncharacterized membrane protein YhaH (DUF805 family)